MSWQIIDIVSFYGQEGTDNLNCPWLLYKNIQNVSFSTYLCLIRVLIFSVALSSYRVVVDEEQVMLGNEILLKCDIPSFVADFVAVNGWVDSEGLGIADDGNYQGNQVFLYTQTYPCKMSHKRAEQCRGLIIGLAPACCTLLSLQRSQSKLKEGTDNAYCPWFPQKITSSNLFQPVFSFSLARDRIMVATITFLAGTFCH